MKKVLFVALLLVLVTVCTSVAFAGVMVTPEEIQTSTDKHPMVVQAPNPLFLDTIFYGKNSKARYSFWMSERDGEFVLYLNWKSKSRGNSGWRGDAWTIDGDEIRSAAGSRIYIDDGVVKFRFKNGRPVVLHPKG